MAAAGPAATTTSKPQLDVAALKSQVEAAMEALLRAADERVQWKPPSTPTIPGTASPLYSFLSGVYHSIEPQLHDATSASARASMETDNGQVVVVLHGDNTFEYSWEWRRPTPRAMEYRVEMRGTWRKPVLNRSRRGDDDQRVFLSATKIRFQRLSNYDADTQSWKLALRTLTRRGSDWAPVGESERSVPPINLVFHCTDDGGLESTGAIVPSQVLTNSPACRVLAGLTKKVANKLGGPLDVMTDKWLPAKHVRLRVTKASSSSSSPSSSPEKPVVRNFNPFFCLAEALLRNKPDRSLSEEEPPDRGLVLESPIVV